MITVKPQDMNDLNLKTWDIASVSWGDKTNTYPPTPFISPSPGKIPRIAIQPVPAELAALVQKSPDTYSNMLLGLMQNVNSCGCNAIMIGGSHELMRAQIQAVEDLASGKVVINPELPAGNLVLPPITPSGPELGILLNPVWLNESVSHCVKILSDYRDIKYIKGWIVMDAIGHQDWGNVLPEDSESIVYNRLTLAYKTACMYSRKSTTKTPNTLHQTVTFTLPASIEKEAIGTCRDYREYLWAIDRLFEPSVWAFSYMPFSNIIDVNGNATSQIETRHKEFYGFLHEYMRFQQGPIAYGGTKEKPRVLFMAYCQTEGYRVVNINTGRTIASYPAPDTGRLRFLAFSALAYGAQGLFFMRMGLEQSRTVGSLRTERIDAPIKYKITTDGNTKGGLVKSDIYNTLKDINEEIDKSSRAFLNSVCIATAHLGDCYGHSDWELKDNFGIVVNAKTNSPSGFLFTNLTRDGVNYTVVMNRDVVSTRTVQLTLDGTKNTSWRYYTPRTTLNNIDIIEPNGEDPGPHDTDYILTFNSLHTNQILKLNLPPAGVAIFEWNDKVS